MLSEFPANMILILSKKRRIHVDHTIQKTIQIFEYLLAVKTLSEQPVRDVEKYDQIWWQNNLPVSEGCFLYGTGNNIEAWLEIHKMKLVTPPKLPKELNGWITNFDSPDKEPRVQDSIVIDLTSGDKEFFDSDLIRISTYNTWFEKWRLWAREMLPKKRTNDLYSHLFAVHQQFQREGENIELVWGQGILSWAIRNMKVRRPLFVTKLELMFDAKGGAFYLIPTSAGTALESDMLIGIEVSNIQRIQELGRQLADTALDFTREESIKPLLREIVQTIHSEGNYVEGLHAPRFENSPSISFSPVMILRKSGGRLWQTELTNAIETLKNGYPIPETIRMLVTDSDDFGEKNMPIETNGTAGTKGSTQYSELLFPLPANEDQKLIAHKLNLNPGVVVQGPPGTGKSHTIANLISHLLAQGKRVLVTSQGEKALKVVKDKIPKEIRSLCVSVLGSDSKAMKDLEDSIGTMAENLDYLQPELLEKDITRIKNELYETRKRIASLHHELRDAAQLEHQRIHIDGTEMSPLEVGQWLHEQDAYAWFPDVVPLGTAFPLTGTQIEIFEDTFNRMSTNDMQRLGSKRSRTKELPVPEHFNEQVRMIKEFKAKVELSQIHIVNWDIHISAEELNSASSLISAALVKLEALEDPWTQMLLKEVVAYPNKAEEWRMFADEMKQRLENIRELEISLREVEIVFPEHLNLTLTKEQLIELHQKLGKGGQVGLWLKFVTGRKYAGLFEAIHVNGLPIRSEADVVTVQRYVELQEAKYKTVLVWNRTMVEYDSETIEASAKRIVVMMQDALTKLEWIHTWNSHVIDPLRGYLEMLGVPTQYQWTDSEWFHALSRGVTTIGIQQRYEEALRFALDLERTLRVDMPESSADWTWKQLIDATVQLNPDEYREVYAELRRLELLEEEFNLINQASSALGNVAPKWIVMLQMEKEAKGKISIPKNINDLWKWSQLTHWWKGYEAFSTVEERQRQIDNDRKTEAKLIRKFVSQSTWLTQVKGVTRGQKASLHAWMNAMKRIGKGMGKYANMYRKEAAQEMESCRSAIPVWIMPIQKVIENLKLSDQMFDVAIIDESSQSNLFAISVLLRAKKIIVVGDDNQISPENVGSDISEISDLMNRYLSGIPHYRRYELKTSLFDLASQMFGSKIVLKEHFRCVPDIIQFSNDLMYGGDMNPLRLPTAAERMEPPVVAIHVPEGFRMESTKSLNRPEAEALVAYIKLCCKDIRYSGKTMGVISLQGPDQANLIEELLREELGAEEMANRALTCGDAYNFQGDERDIMFLSMVAAPNKRIGVLNKRSDMQRFNVAASRARDQMILFHSVTLKDLNSDCMRYRLLLYCQNPSRTANKLEEYIHEFDSKFEKDVFTLATARGYRVIPQYKVGTFGKKIDLVVEGLRSRLAIECDGDRWHGIDVWEQDMERQRILERVGWTFWRVRGSTFYRNPALAMEGLWERLKDLGIEPHRESI
jgi:very-short-patch-repair endonuclease